MLSRIAILLTALSLIMTCGLAQTTFPATCPAGGGLPFNAPPVSHPVDSSCGLKGKTTSPAPTQLQNSLKNNFCATAATPATFTPQAIVALQGKTTVPAGQGKEPANRAPLKALGEGKLIRMKAFIIEAHHADVGAGESVNCNGPKEEDNDIHIALGTAVDTQECASVTAEISPHERPASWNEIGHFETFDPVTRLNTVNPAIASRLQAQPFRFTGQLFFDASHPPCPCGKNCNPKRSSLWEIHPVYKIDVCKAATSCDVNNEAHWLSFESWWKSMAPVQTPAPPHAHALHEPEER